MKKSKYILPLLLVGSYLAYRIFKKNPTDLEEPGYLYGKYHHIYVSTIPNVRNGKEYINIYDEINDNSFWLEKSEAEEYIAERQNNPVYAVVFMDVKVIPVEELKQRVY